MDSKKQKMNFDGYQRIYDMPNVWNIICFVPRFRQVW